MRCNLHLINNRVIFYVRNGLSGVTEGRWPSRGDTRRVYTMCKRIGRRRSSGHGDIIYIYISDSGQWWPGLAVAGSGEGGGRGYNTVKGPANYCLSPRVGYTYYIHIQTSSTTYTYICIHHGLRVRLIFHKSAWLSPEIVFRARPLRYIYIYI